MTHTGELPAAADTLHQPLCSGRGRLEPAAKVSHHPFIADYQLASIVQTVYYICITVHCLVLQEGTRRRTIINQSINHQLVNDTQVLMKILLFFNEINRLELQSHKRKTTTTHD